MTAPFGFTHRDCGGLHGLLARWWYRRRVRQIKRRLR